MRWLSLRLLLIMSSEVTSLMLVAATLWTEWQVLISHLLLFYFCIPAHAVATYCQPCITFQSAHGSFIPLS